MATKVQQLNSRLSGLETEYNPWKNLYKDLRDNLVPYNGWFPDESTGPYDITKNDQRMNINVTRAVRIFGAGMYSGMCSPSRPWIQLGMEDQGLNDYGPVKAWLDYVEKLYLKTFAQSNFYKIQRQIMEDQGWAGIGVYLPEKLPGPPWVYFHFFPVGSYRLAAGDKGKVDTIYRPIKMEARKMRQAFGDSKLSNQVKTAVEKNPYQKFDVVHAIEPRGEGSRQYGKIDAINMPFKSCWYEKGKENLLRESGFNSFPAIVSKFMDVGDFPYGAGPGIDAIKQIKLSHRMEKDGLKGFHREVMPPLVAPSRFEGIVDLTPDGITFGLDGDKGSIAPILQTNVNWQHFQFRLDAIGQSVDRAFMVDLFLMVLNSSDDDPRRTATEILKKHEEKIAVLGPVVESQITDNFDVCIDLMFQIFLDVPGLIPPPPPEIQGQGLKVKYISTLAQAQRMAELGKLHAYLDIVDRVVSVDQQAIAATDSYELLKEAEESIGLPPKILRDADDYRAILEAQAQQQQQATQMEQMAAVAGAAKDMGSAKIEDTALGELKKEAGAE